MLRTSTGWTFARFPAFTLERVAVGDWWDPRSYSTVGQELNPLNLKGSFAQTSLSISDALGGILNGLSGNGWSDFINAGNGDNGYKGLLEQTECDKAANYTVVALLYRSRIKICLSLLLAFSIPSLLFARLVRPWTYQEMFDKADLVVIAAWVSTKDTDEHSTLQDVEPPVKVIGVTTEFETRLVLKGANNIKKLQLHHYRFQNENDALWANRPSLVIIRAPVRAKDGFEYPGGGTFLLFLTKEADGRYAPVTGQTDPAALSALHLTGGAQ
jgi:hypothetical protein